MIPNRRQTDWQNLVAVIIICAAILFFFYVDISGCAPRYTPHPMPVVETPCDAAFYHIQNQGCEYLLVIPGRDEIAGTTDDMDWIHWCLKVQTSGFIKMDLDCAMTKLTCNEIESCL